MTKISESPNREKQYSSVLSNSPQSLKDIIKFGHKLMQKENLHRHFFRENSNIAIWLGKSDLLPTVKYLTFFGLGLEEDYNKYKNKILTANEIEKVLKIYERRIVKRIPVEYITGTCKYLDYEFYVNENVLVPRSLMHTRFKDFLQSIDWQNYKVLDLCTGSGCVGISLALLNNKITVDLADISDKALEVANVNIKKHGLEQRVKTIQSDLFDNITQKYDLIISNPPYITENEFNKGPMELKNEPKIALVAKDSGVEIAEKIINNAENYLNKHGKLIMEVGVPAANVLKKRYRGKFKWYAPKAPKGKGSILDFITWGREGVLVWDSIKGVITDK